MGYDMRPASWGNDSPKVSARLKPCYCGANASAWTDTAGMWTISCGQCGTKFAGDDMLGFETWQEAVRTWNSHKST